MTSSGDLISELMMEGCDVIHVQCGDEDLTARLVEKVGAEGRVQTLSLRDDVPGAGDDDSAVDWIVATSGFALVSCAHREALLGYFRGKLSDHGKTLISVVIANRALTEAQRLHPDLAAQGLHEATLKSEIIGAAAAAGFAGIEVAQCPRGAWIEREGIEFRMMTAILLASTQEEDCAPGEFSISEWTCGDAENAETANVPFLSGVCRRGSDCC